MHSPTRPTNLVASVRQRLRNLSSTDGEDFQRVLTRYAGERLLYRLMSLPVGSQFVLKSALLFIVWEGTLRRPTRDIDLLGPGVGTPDTLRDLFQAVCNTAVDPDGLTFDANSVTAAVIREDQDYEGVRVRLTARLGNARIPLQVDIGFGDAVTPPPTEVTLPTLLDFPAVRMHAYPAETVVAEKCEAMVKLGLANTRMKDYYDLWTLSETRGFDGALLAEALNKTFARRGTPLPVDLPIALSDAFATSADKQAQWRAFLKRSNLSDAPTELSSVIDRLSAFLWPALSAASDPAQWSSRREAGRSWT